MYLLFWQSMRYNALVPADQVYIMKHYLIDSENVGDFWIPLLDLPAETAELIVFYTKNSPHMSYESLIKLKESDRHVTFIKCYEGTNALDFQLCSELGYLIASHEEDDFIIVTNDTGYDAAVKYWRRKEYSVKRIAGKDSRTGSRRRGSTARSDVAAEVSSILSRLAKASDPDEAHQEKNIRGTAADSGIFAEEEIESGEYDPDGPEVEGPDSEESDYEEADYEEADYEGTDSEESDYDEPDYEEDDSEESDSDEPYYEEDEYEGSDSEESEGHDYDEPDLEESEAEDPDDEESGSDHEESGSDGSDPESEGSGSEDQESEESGEYEADGDVSGEQDPDVHGDSAPADSYTEEGSEQFGGEETLTADPDEEEEFIADPEEITAIVNCIGMENLAELHNQLIQFYGENGKDVYKSLKSLAPTIEKKNWSKEEKFLYYCVLIIRHSDEPEEALQEENVRELAEFLLGAENKRKNLNSLRYALLKHYGKEKGRRYYFMLKPYVKALNQM